MYYMHRHELARNTPTHPSSLVPCVIILPPHFPGKRAVGGPGPPDHHGDTRHEKKAISSLCMVNSASPSLSIVVDCQWRSFMILSVDADSFSTSTVSQKLPSRWAFSSEHLGFSSFAGREEDRCTSRGRYQSLIESVAGSFSQILTPRRRLFRVAEVKPGKAKPFT